MDNVIYLLNEVDTSSSQMQFIVIFIIVSVVGYYLWDRHLSDESKMRKEKLRYEVTRLRHELADKNFPIEEASEISNKSYNKKLKGIFQSKRLKVFSLASICALIYPIYASIHFLIKFPQPSQEELYLICLLLTIYSLVSFFLGGIAATIFSDDNIFTASILGILFGYSFYVLSNRAFFVLMELHLVFINAR